jgi:hypothetical protein
VQEQLFLAAGEEPTSLR